MSESRNSGFFRPWYSSETEINEATAIVTVDNTLRGHVSRSGREEDDENAVSSASSTTSATSTILTTLENGTDLSDRAATDSTSMPTSSSAVERARTRRGSESSDDVATSTTASLQDEDVVGCAVQDTTSDSRAYRSQRPDDYSTSRAISARLTREFDGEFNSDNIHPLEYLSTLGLPRPQDFVATINGGAYATPIASLDVAGPSSAVSATLPGFLHSFPGFHPAIHLAVHRGVQSGIYPGIYPGILPPGFYDRSVEEAAQMVHRQDTAAKQIKKMRPKRFRCEYCEMAFSNNGQLKGHIRIHTGEKPFKCDDDSCGKSFTRNEELTRHKRIHTGVRPHSCVICGKPFGRKDHLKKHMRTHEIRDPYRASTTAAFGVYALQQVAEFSPYTYQI